MGKHVVKASNARKLKQFGEHMKELRVKKGFTQEQLSLAAGVSENTISTIENGKLNTTVATCLEIAKALGIHHREIFNF